MVPSAKWTKEKVEKAYEIHLTKLYFFNKVQYAGLKINEQNILKIQHAARIGTWIRDEMLPPCTNPRSGNHSLSKSLGLKIV